MEKTKVTQKMALEYVIANCNVPADIEEKLKTMLAQVEKKSASGSKSMTPTQKENVELKTAIYSEMEKNGFYTITDMLKDFECLKGKDYTNQRISAIVRQLVNDGVVERVVDKRRSLFHKIGE